MGRSCYVGASYQQLPHARFKRDLLTRRFYAGLTIATRKPGIASPAKTSKFTHVRQLQWGDHKKDQDDLIWCWVISKQIG